MYEDTPTQCTVSGNLTQNYLGGEKGCQKSAKPQKHRPVNPSERTSEESEGAERAGAGCPPSQGRENFAFGKTVFGAYFGERLAYYYDFLQIARGQNDNTKLLSMPFQIHSSLHHCKWPIFCMSPKVICEGAKRLSGGMVWEGVSPSQGRENFAFGIWFLPARGPPRRYNPDNSKL